MGGLVVFPTRTLVVNVGDDGTGTHGRGGLRLRKNISKTTFLKKINWPREVRMNDQAYEIICKSLARENDCLILRLANTFRWLQAKFLMRKVVSRIT